MNWAGVCNSLPVLCKNVHRIGAESEIAAESENKAVLCVTGVSRIGGQISNYNCICTIVLSPIIIRNSDVGRMIKRLNSHLLVLCI